MYLLRLVVLVVLVALVGCGMGQPEDVDFDSSAGTGDGVSGCICAYYDGTDNDLALEVTCTSGNSTFNALSLFVDPHATTELGGKLIFGSAIEPANYSGGAVGRLDPLSDPTDASDTKVIREVSGIEFRWDEQDACNVAQPCEIDSVHILGGALHMGHGGCEDYYATLNKQPM
ncbi:MAG: hypothetical protein ABI591_20095 [Kofleriaceae bacterium]